ncbi:MAG: CDP-alcohol phosphatidyltransferase family protein [Bacteroidota bacterium]
MERRSSDVSSLVEARREPRHLLRHFEAYVLPRIAAVLPRWIQPDHLTAVGVLSAFAIGACYALSVKSSSYMWLANALWVVNWLGDSLDGTLARVRRIERPRYGFYLDHITDMFAAAAICIGLGLSPYMLLSVGLACLIGFYLLSINVYLETHVLGVFQFGYGLMGPTELRVILILVGAAIALEIAPIIHLKGIPLGPIDLLGLVAVAGMFGVLGKRVLKNLRQLSQLEPPNVKIDRQSSNETG